MDRGACDGEWGGSNAGDACDADVVAHGAVWALRASAAGVACAFFLGHHVFGAFDHPFVSSWVHRTMDGGGGFGTEWRHGNLNAFPALPWHAMPEGQHAGHPRKNPPAKQLVGFCV